MKKVLAGLCVAATMITVSGAALAADNSFYGAVDIGQAKLRMLVLGYLLVFHAMIRTLRIVWQAAITSIRISALKSATRIMAM